jgi:hypothetical protein
MSPEVTDWEELTFLSEKFDSQTGEFQCTTFAVIHDDVVYFGQLNIPKLEISFQQLSSALNPPNPRLRYISGMAAGPCATHPGSRDSPCRRLPKATKPRLV